MNASDQAQKGFKTFVLTLSVSLIIFSVIYYFISASPSQGLDKEISGKEGQKSEEATRPAAFRTETNAFKQLADLGKLSNSKADAPVVLAGATTTQVTQSTTSVPDTGMFGMTMGLFGGLALFALAIFLTRRNVARLAIASFERDVLRDL